MILLLALLLLESPLTQDALQMESPLPLVEWSQDDNQEAFRTLQKVIQVWANKGIHEYLIVGKENSEPFKWTIVPYPPDINPLFRHLTILWKMTFGTSPQEAKKFELEEPVPIHISTTSSKPDPFSDPQVIQRQLVYEGKRIYVLYNYAPITSEHFLLIPKERKVYFSDLDLEEYLEAMHLAQKLIRHFRTDSKVAYIFDKSGERAGQTVPHWHEHLVITPQDDLWGQFKMLKNMFLGSSPLPPDELKARVEKYRQELSEVL